MAATIQSTATYGLTGAFDSHDLSLPTGIVSGDLVQAVVGWGSGTSGGGDNNAAALSGFTKAEEVNVTNNVGGALFYRHADGTEGSTAELTFQNADEVAAVLMRIDGHEASGTPDFSTGASGDSTSPDPGSVSVTGGSADCLLIEGIIYDGSTSVSSYSTNYTEVDSVQQADGDVGAFVASRSATVSSEDPDAATGGATDQWCAWTIAVRPGSAASYDLAINSGAYSVSGTAANLEYHSEVSAEGGSYSVSGQDANFLLSYPLSAEGGSYSVSGQDAALDFDSVLGVGGGSYSVSGQDVTLVAVGDYSLLAESGSYGVSGTDVGFLFDQLFGTDSGAYGVTGQTIDLSLGAAPAVPGEWVEYFEGEGSWSKESGLSGSWSAENAASDSWTEEDAL